MIAIKRAIESYHFVFLLLAFLYRNCCWKKNSTPSSSSFHSIVVKFYKSYVSLIYLTVYISHSCGWFDCISVDQSTFLLEFFFKAFNFGFSKTCWRFFGRFYLVLYIFLRCLRQYSKNIFSFGQNLNFWTNLDFSRSKLSFSRFEFELFFSWELVKFRYFYGQFLVVFFFNV